MGAAGLISDCTGCIATGHRPCVVAASVVKWKMDGCARCAKRGTLGVGKIYNREPPDFFCE
jgi:hypothetical protein